MHTITLASTQESNNLGHWVRAPQQVGAPDSRAFLSTNVKLHSFFYSGDCDPKIEISTYNYMNALLSFRVYLYNPDTEAQLGVVDLGLKK